MKFHFNHDLANKTLTIPRAALQFSGLEIPPCQLAEAGISPTAALESFVEEGRIIVQAAMKTAADVLIDELDDDVRTMLEDSGVQLEGVCRLLEKEEISE